MKMYKGFNKDMTCRGFQFEEGKTYETETASLCNAGFHACERPLDVFNYYSPNKSEYHEVEMQDVSDEKSDDSKRVAKKITIGAKLSIKNLIDAQIQYVQEHCTNEYNAEIGEPATAGYRGAATAGEYGAATSRGKSSVGVNGIACARGNDCMVRGGLGSVLVIVSENDDDCDIVEWKAVVVDGDTIKADVWYKLQGGELVEVEE